MTTLAQPPSVQSCITEADHRLRNCLLDRDRHIIGTGIFTSLGFQLTNIQSGFALLMLWVIGGIAALCGALCYGELAAALPAFRWRIPFSLEIYHPALGSWPDSCPLRLDLQRLLHSPRCIWQYFNGGFRRGSPVVLSFVVVWIVTIFMWESASRERVPECSTLVKLLLIGALIGAGFFFHQNSGSVSCLPLATKLRSSAVHSRSHWFT